MPVNPIEAQYFMDEAGQDHIFDRNGNVVIETGNNSRFFMVGFLYADNPDMLGREINNLRFRLRGDPYLAFTESMRADDPRKRTYYQFHATDDCFEARYAMYKLLREFDGLRFMACIIDKWEILAEIRQAEAFGQTYHFTRNDLYDRALGRLIRDQIAKSEVYKFFFAIRGKPRTRELQRFLLDAQDRYRLRWNKDTGSKIEVYPMYSKDHPLLQAADYFLWGLQRLYEYMDFRYVNYLWHHFRLVIDMHDTRIRGTGRYYNQHDPLSPETLDGHL